MQRRTKIVATLGPSTDDPKVLDKIIDAGVDVVRVNFSHGTSEEHKERVERVRNRARAHGRQVGVLVDLQGPKIRIERSAGVMPQSSTSLEPTKHTLGMSEEEAVGAGFVLSWVVTDFR